MSRERYLEMKYTPLDAQIFCYTSAKIRLTRMHLFDKWLSIINAHNLPIKCISHGIEPRLSLLENNMHPTTLRSEMQLDK